MTDEARATRARLTAWAYNEITRDDYTPESIQEAAEWLFDAGVAEGIRQAREAVVGVSFWEEADAVAVEDALDALETT